MTLQVQSPFQQFFDLDGDPLDNGSIYIGNSGQNPQQYPIPIFWDAAGTIPALQPVKTLNGYAVRNGTPSRIWVENTDYSITVKDSRGRVVFTALSVTAVSFNALAAPTGSSLVGFIQAGPHAVPRTLLDRGRDAVSIKDFANYSTNAAQAILDMAADYGFVRVPFGNFPIGTSVTIDVPLWFDEGAAFTAAGGITVTITNVVESPRQYIFQGTGTYTLTNDSDSGENSRHVHASWFGAFPRLTSAGDQAPFFNKAFAAMGNARESVVECDFGGYVISSTVTMTRAGWLKGDGSRRTVFKFDGDGYIGFTDTSAGICKITDCNFELIPGTVTNRVSAFVEFNGNESEIYNVRLGETEKGIVINGNSARIYNIASAYGADKPAGSSVIHIRKGNGAFVHDVNLATSSAFGPECIVRVGGGDGGINNMEVRSIYHMTPSVSVIVEATNDNISGLIIDGVNYNGFNGTPPSHLVKMTTSNASSIENVSINNVLGSSRSVSMVGLFQNSSTFMRRVSIDNVMDKRVDGNGIELVRTAGTLEFISVGNGVHLESRTNPIFISGTVGKLLIAPGVDKDTNQVTVNAKNILDDNVMTVPLLKSVFSGMVLVSTNASSTLNYGLYSVRAASTPNVATITQSATMDTAIIPLTGTTGTDGRITVGVTNGVLYLENRSGVAINATLTLLSL